MQTGIFYVRLRPTVDPSETRVDIDGKSLFVGEILKKERPYPVLAVEHVERSTGSSTLYHIPVDNNEIRWLPAELFLFARD